MVAACAAALLASLIGLSVAIAASSSGPVSACATKNGELRLKSQHGRCARGTHPVTLGRRGPTGATGPSTAYDLSQVDDGSEDTVDVSGDDHLKLPAGTYIVTWDVQDSASLDERSYVTYEVSAECFLGDGGPNLLQERTAEGAMSSQGQANGGYVYGYSATMGATTSLILAKAGFVNLHCSGTIFDAYGDDEGAVSFNADDITAIKVGKLS